MLAVFLAVGIKSAPTSSLTLFLYNHLPFYKGLRQPQKWVAVIIPIYLFINSGRLSSKINKINYPNNRFKWIILAAIIIMGCACLCFGALIVRSDQPLIPSDWSEINNLLLNRSAQSYGCSDRILFLPWHLYLGFGWIGNCVANPASAFFTCPVLSGTDMEYGGIYDNSQSPEGRVMSKIGLRRKGRMVRRLSPVRRCAILFSPKKWTSLLIIGSMIYHICI